jgi:hypothetical protein
MSSPAVPGGAPAGRPRYPEPMTQQPAEQPPADMAALLAQRGVVVTDENRARARRRLNAARERRDPQLRAQLRAQLGMRPTTTA